MLSSAPGLILLLAWLAAALAPVMLLRLVMASSFSWVTGPASVARLAQCTRAAGKRPSSIREAEGGSEVRGGAVYSSWGAAEEESRGDSQASTSDILVSGPKMPKSTILILRIC